MIRNERGRSIEGIKRPFVSPRPEGEDDEARKRGEWDYLLQYVAHLHAVARQKV